MVLYCEIVRVVGFFLLNCTMNKLKERLRLEWVVKRIPSKAGVTSKIFFVEKCEQSVWSLWGLFMRERRGAFCVMNNVDWKCYYMFEVGLSATGSEKIQLYIIPWGLVYSGS